MATPLSTELSRWFGRAVIVARGAEDARAQAERALALGDATGALSHAREILQRVPRSPVGLALAADAAEAAWLDDDAARYLEELASVVPWQAEIWLRLGNARARAARSRDSVVEALARATTFLDAPHVVASAALALADLDFASRDSVRALAWLDRAWAAEPSPRVAVRRALALLDRGDPDAARLAMEGVTEPAATDGVAALVAARLATDERATAWLLRALILDAPGAEAALARKVSLGAGPVSEEVTAVVRDKGLLDHPLFRAAFAQRRGDLAAAREALKEACARGDRDAATELLRVALVDEDVDALSAALAALPVTEGRAEARAVLSAALAEREAAVGWPLLALDALDRAGQLPFAQTLRRRAMAAFVPLPPSREVEKRVELVDKAPEQPDGVRTQDKNVDQTTDEPATPEPSVERAPWRALDIAAVVTELRRAARTVDDLPALLETEALLTQSQRPLRLAILGEFNAGKSTFLNAFLGSPVAPMGVLPTTATLHHVIYSPDPFARIFVEDRPDRVVLPERLRATLDEIHEGGGTVVRVTVGLPLDRLRTLELLDTPGFNAPDAAHARAARAAFEEAHLLVWVLDATQPLKDSEKRVLEEVASRRVPLLVLANKSDRLSPKQRLDVAAYVAASLQKLAIEPICPPAFFSARRALDGRLGDDEARASSSWDSIETIFEQTLLGRADEWRDQALRRSALAQLGPLEATAQGLAEGELGRARAGAERSARLAEAAAHLRSRPVAVLRSVERSLTEPRKALAADLAPLPEGTEGARAARGYAVHRAVHRLGPALADGALQALPSLVNYIDELRPQLAAGSFASLHGLLHGLPSVRDVTTLPTVELLEATMEPMAVLLDDWASAPPSSSAVAAPLVLRLAALRHALEATPPRTEPRIEQADEIERDAARDGGAAS
jgi:cellulose synthase operon protein C